MRANLAFHRLIIDLDLAGNPIGICVESHDGDDRTSFTVLERPGPFDTVADCLIAAVNHIDRLHGREMELPL